jgi:hypothetical protein
VDFRLKGTLLTAHFQVQTDRTPHTNPALPLDDSQWGLWDWDVVELFVSATGSPDRLPYYEFQVSPLGQYLELEIFEPRKRFNRDFKSGFEHKSLKLNDKFSWTAEMAIPLEKLGWNGDPSRIVGNAFAILGPPESRAYWSLFLGQQTKPDFHLPQEFKKLV